MTINGFITETKATFKAFAANLEKPGVKKFIPAALLGKRSATVYEEDNASVIIGTPNSSTPLLAAEKVEDEVNDGGSVSDSGSDVMNATKVDDGFDSDDGDVGKVYQEDTTFAVNRMVGHLYYGGDPDKPHNNRWYFMLEPAVKEIPLGFI
jgi:hypothetical protein